MTRFVEGAGLAAVAWALLAGSVPAQVEPGGNAPAEKVLTQQERRELAAAAGERWLASDQTDEKLLGETVTAMLVDAAVGLAWLGEQLPQAAQKPAQPRSKGVYSLCTQVTLEFLRRQQKSEMVFVGQYDPLSRLQPFAGEFLFGLLTDTPDWYPFTFRVRLVPALRDLQKTPPSPSRLDAIVELAGDEREPVDLRRALAAMLWQWGNKRFANDVIAELMQATAEGDAEDRVLTTLRLADYYCLLRDYAGSARAHRSAQRLAEGAGFELQPVAWYAAACVHALLGERDLGMAALERCARMHASPHLDSSLRLQRSLFEKDPEIALLRADERFPALLELAFGPAKAGAADPKQPGKRDGGR